MAAVAAGTSFWLVVVLLGQAFWRAITSVIAHLNGAGKRQHKALHLHHAYWLAEGVSLLIMLVLTMVGEYPAILFIR